MTRLHPALSVSSYQARIAEWVNMVFGAVVAADGPERTLRFVEEAVELAQAVGLDADIVHRLVDYVFSREKGEPGKEVAGCAVTLLAAATANGVDAEKELDIELSRIQEPEVIARCRRRQSEKREALVALDGANRMDAPGGPQCGCGRPSAHESGWCGTECEAKFGDKVILYIEDGKPAALPALSGGRQFTRIDRLLTQLAGCSVAAMGGTDQVAKRGDFGWSPAYEDVLTLRRKFDEMFPRFETALERAEALWQLLDDIDTLDDAAREHDSVFREQARAIQKKRWAIYNPDAKT